MPFYTFVQNNSGGRFVFDEHKGIGHYVIIEATSQDDAASRALQHLEEQASKVRRR